MSLLGNDDEGSQGGSDTEGNGGTPDVEKNAVEDKKDDGNATWMEKLGIDAELRKEAAFADLPDVNALAKGYINAQRMVGKDKFVVPNQDAPDAEWRETFKKLGLPEGVSDYKFDLTDVEVSKEDNEAYKNFAHAAGILPKQADAFMRAVEAHEQAKDENYMAEKRTAMDESIKGLQKEWGQAFQPRLARAQRLVREVGGEDAVKYLDATGLGDDTGLARILDKAAAIIYAEDNLPPGTPPGTSMMTPGQANEKIAEIQGNLKHPYYDSNHPSHNHAVKEYQKLLAISMGMKPQ